MTITVSPTAASPTHHIKLDDGVTSVGLILRSGQTVNPKAITRRPRQNGQYSPFTQSDWGSGRGIKYAASERSRFSDSKRAITRHPNTVMIGGQETYATGYRKAEAYLPGDVTWQSLLTTERYIAYKFTASASTNRSAVYLWIRRRGTPTSTLTVELCSDNAGNPGSVLKTVTKTTTNITDTVSELVEFEFSSVQAVTSGTSYWVKVYTSTADSSTNYWQVGTDAARTNALTKCSSDNGSTDAWAAATYDLYFRVVDDTDLLGGLFFNYLGQLYFLTRQSGATAPKLYMNGYRGVATGGSQSTTVLQDTTQTFTVDALIGATLLIIDGTNSEWQTPYRTITDNDANTITVSPAMPKAFVAGSSQYIVIGSSVWTEITSHGLTVLPTSVSSAGEVCYFAQGDTTQMIRMREYISNSVWTREFATEDNYAKFLLDFRHPTKGLMIGKANDVGTLGQPVFTAAKAEKWGRRLNYPLLISNCNATTGWTAGANVSLSAENTDFVEGTASLKMTVSGAAGTTYFAKTMKASGMNAIRFWVKANTSRAEGDWKVFLSISGTAASQIELLSLPELPSAEWTQVTLPFDQNEAGTRKVASIGFTTTTTSGYILLDGLELYVQGAEVPLGNKGEKITGLERYGDPEVPWVFRTQSAGSIENGVFNPIPLRELSTAESVHNGVGHTVHNVYLYFSYLHGIERFYRNNLDDVGPNRDEGFPDTRRGYVGDMKGYIGRFFYNNDVRDGYSSILESSNGADHHETYRCDTAGKRIRNIFIQVIPGDAADRLWFTEGEDIAWLPLPGNTLREDSDDTFMFTHEAVLETGWMVGQEQDAVKIFSAVKLTTENLSSNRKIEWDYKTDDNSTWTPVSTAFTSSPVQEISLNVSCKRLKLRFRLQTNDNTETPIIKSMMVSATTRPETRWTYSFNTFVTDAAIDLEGDEDFTNTANSVITQLDTWMEANTILTMSSVFNPFHSKSVMLEPVIVQPVTFIADESSESFSLTVNLLEP
jgi:hypothetical protein